VLGSSAERGEAPPGAGLRNRTIRCRRFDLHCQECGTQLVDRDIDGRRRSLCPACGWILYRRLNVAAAVLIERDGALLLACRGPGLRAFPGTWNLPSGYCEPDEPPHLTAAREAAEETGLQVRTGRLVDAYYFDDDPRGSGLLLVYEADVIGGELAADGQEAVEIGFFPPQSLPAPLCGGGHDRAVRAWADRILDRWQPGEPPHYCPHCACPLQERQAFGRLRHVCPSCGYVHFRSPKLGVSVLVERAGRVLLVQRAIEPGLGQWSLPSGFVEWDEAPEAAAAREVAEETGLILGHLDLLAAEQYTEDFRGAGLNLTYRAQAVGGDLEAGDDAARARFFAPTELPPPEAIAFASHRGWLEHWQAEQEA
jgi:ADP-ribose pyrophosphatase YjhB (NUDIX family)